ncbi:MAG: hypothetical protein ACP5O4_03190, partial [bacterium]
MLSVILSFKLSVIMISCNINEGSKGSLGGYTSAIGKVSNNFGTNLGRDILSYNIGRTVLVICYITQEYIPSLYV